MRVWLLAAPVAMLLGASARAERDEEGTYSVTVQLDKV